MVVGKGIDFAMQAYLACNIGAVRIASVPFNKVAEQGANHGVVTLLCEIDVGKVIHKWDTGAFGRSATSAGKKPSRLSL